MKKCPYCAFVIFALLMSTAPAAQAPIPKALAEAKTVYLFSDGASDNLVNDFAAEMVKWGRFTLVDTQAASDITIALGGLNRSRGWTMAITDSHDKSPLWTTAQKRAMRSKVSTDLVKKLRARLEGKQK